MAYVTGNLNIISWGTLESDLKEWSYKTTDQPTTFQAVGYISDAKNKGMSLGDLVYVINNTAGSVSCYLMQVQSISTAGAATLAAPAGVGGSQNANFRNLIDGGDFTTNPWQRGTSFNNINSNLLVTYTADRWFASAPSSTVSAVVSKQANTTIPGFGQAFQFGRQQNASTTSAITVGQIVESADSIRAQSQPVTLSFWALAGSNLSASNNTMGVQVIQGTGTDQSATSALAGTWTGQANVISTTQGITATATRYTFSGTVASNATQLGVLLNYTPTGSAGAGDFIQLLGVQLEIGGQPTPFEHRDAEVELALAQRYAFQVNEPASGVTVAVGAVTGTNRFNFMVPLPVQMRAAPSVTVVNGSFGAQFTGSYLAVTGLAGATAHTPNFIALVASATGASNSGTILVGGSGTGSILASADY
jgi:hypothetical protein